MSASNIEWTDATWNPTTGCTKISPGCKHCYAETMHARLTAMGQKKYAKPFRVVQPWEDDLDAPLHWRKPRRVFVNSMSDLFHEDVPDRYIAAVFGVMAATPQHTYQVLTKRAERMEAWFRALQGPLVMAPTAGLLRSAYHAGIDAEAMRIVATAKTQTWPLPNVWLGVSVEDSRRAEERIPHLLRVPAAVRFLSCEPLLEHIDLSRWLCRNETMRSLVDGRVYYVRCGIGWAIVGGESGHDARPFDLAWARSLIAQCRAASVPMFMKQIGNVVVGFDGNQYHRSDKGGDPEGWAEELRVREYPAVRS